MTRLLLLFIAIAFIVVATVRFRLHPLLALLCAAIGFGLFSSMPLETIVTSINSGFGDTLGHIGIVIIAGTIIGTFLEKSGGAYTLAESILRRIGKKRIIPAMGLIGWLVSIPVFADSGFVILSPLNKALTKRAGISLAGTAIVLSLCLTISHTLVPPTPGPIAAAGLLEADLGLVIVLALPISLIVMLMAWLYAANYAGRFWMDANPQLSEAMMQKRMDNAPGAMKALLPIVVPIILIILKSVAALPTSPLGQAALYRIVSFVGSPVIALLIGILFSTLLPRHLTTDMLSSSGWVGEGVMSAAMIIMITGAGGAFGRVLQNSGIADLLGNSLAGAKLGLWLPFMLAAAIKTAQGSSTVAIITTASIMAPLLPALGFQSEVMRALLVLAIGSGSMVVSHANDSFFWVVTQMSGMDVKTGYRLHSLGTLFLGLCAMMLIWITSLFV
ncbi:GntP family permease [candidate division KSB1 bacterium]|nr:GntP family permease [candidate division KSB1 bacterium]